MINYELALKLKDAGFPGSDDWVEHPHISGEPYFMVDGYAVPTLSELIEACGGKFFELGRYRKKFWASGRRNKNEIIATTGHFNTPEEALAELWLAINKK